MAKFSSLDMRLEAHSVRQLMVPAWADHPPELSHCRVWTGFRQDEKGRVHDFGIGYGKINFYVNEGSRKFALHRVILVLEEIKIINPNFNWKDKIDRAQFFALFDAYSKVGLTVDHICNCRPCFNFNHLCWASIQKQLEFRTRVVAKKIAAGMQVPSLSLRPKAQEKHWLILADRTERNQIKLRRNTQDEAHRISVALWISYIRSKEFKETERALWIDT